MAELVVVTGACGNLGSEIVAALEARGLRVRAVDLESDSNRATAHRFGADVDTEFADVTVAADIERVVEDADIVVHTAALLPPATELRPDLAETVNVGGTANVISALEAAGRGARLIFTSSVSVHGPQPTDAPLIQASDEPYATDNYTRHKIDGEERIRASSVPGLVFRVGVAMASATTLKSIAMVRGLFDIPLEQQMELVHPADVATAIARAVERDDLWGRTILLGGGSKCRIRYRDYLEATLSASGIGSLPAEAFGTEPYYTGWMDTRAGEDLLGYQQHSFDDIAAEMALGLSRYQRVVRLVRPAVRVPLLGLSGHWRRALLSDPLGRVGDAI